MKADSVLSVALGVVVLAGGACFKACTNGLDRGYWLGCDQGSRGKSQVVVVDGERRCLPHEQAIKARKP